MPTHAFARLDGRNEPCVQSWNTMKVRSMKPAVGIARAATSRYETSRAQYMSAVSAMYGSAEVAMSSRPLRTLGLAYGASRSRQKACPSWGSSATLTAGTACLLRASSGCTRPPVGISRRSSVTVARGPVDGRVASPAPSGPSFGNGSVERIDDDRVELRSRASPQLVEGHLG